MPPSMSTDATKWRRSCRRTCSRPSVGSQPTEPVGAHVGSPRLALGVGEQQSVVCERAHRGPARTLPLAEPVLAQQRDGRLVEGEASGLVGLGVLLPQLLADLDDRPADGSSAGRGRCRSTAGRRPRPAGSRSPTSPRGTCRSPGPRRGRRRGSSAPARPSAGSTSSRRCGGGVASTAGLRAMRPHRRACSSDWRRTVWQIRTVRGDRPDAAEVGCRACRGRSAAATRPCGRRARAGCTCRRSTRS